MLFDQAHQEIFDHVNAALGFAAARPEGVELILEIPPDPRMGDFAFPTFKLAKSLRKAPPVIAKELFEKLQADAKFGEKYLISTLGPYVNFTVRKEVLLGACLASILQSGAALASTAPASRRKVVLEFSSPNVAKAFNIYHLRGTMIGNSLYRIFQARGWDPVAINHLGDWGTQYGTLAMAYEKWGDDRELEKRGIEYLVELYIRINKDIEKDAGLSKLAREYFSRLEKGDPAIGALWKKFVKLSLGEFTRTYQRLGVHFDHFWGESFYVSQIPALEEKLKAKGLLKESEGALVVDLEPFGMPPCLIRKQDGSTLYATRDLAAALYRHDQFHFARMVYVVGGEQKLHFAQLFKVLDLLGEAWAKDCVHVDFGLYRFGDAESGYQKMSTRKGAFVTMESVLDHAVERVRQKIAEKNMIPDEAERAAAAEIIGVGAIIFNDMSTDRNHDVNFDLERVLDFDGETGPYVQYAHTRCLGILRNSPAALRDGIDVPGLLDLGTPQPGLEKLWKSAQAKLQEVEELDLIRALSKLPLVLDQVLEQYRPSALASYLIDVTKAFNQFYRAHKVLVDDEELARARLSLVVSTQRTLLKGAELLGMKMPERM